MFAPRSPLARTRPDPVPTSSAAGTRLAWSAGAMLRLWLVAMPLTAAFPAGASAQGLGTMQVTARVLPGRPVWAGLTEAQALVQQALLSSSKGPEIRRAGLVQAWAELDSTGGRRRLLVRVDYLRN
jgi:hypothetical protein